MDWKILVKKIPENLLCSLVFCIVTNQTDDTITYMSDAGNKNGRDKKMKNSLEQQANDLIAAGQVCGFRFCDHDVNVGDELANSCVWDGDVKLDDELPGTCAFESWSAMVNYAQYSKGIGGKIVLITGDNAGRGTDFADEIYVANAKVVAVMTW